MTDFTFYREEVPNLHFTNLTNYNFMEDKKGGNSPKSLQDLKKELQVMTQQEALKITGGKAFEKDKWHSGCGGLVPQ